MPLPVTVTVRRAGNGTRTRDPNLGKVVLYQLSYSRDSRILARTETGDKRLPRPTVRGESSASGFKGRPQFTASRRARAPRTTRSRLGDPRGPRRHR